MISIVLDGDALYYIAVLATMALIFATIMFAIWRNT